MFAPPTARAASTFVTWKEFKERHQLFVFCTISCYTQIVFELQICQYAQKKLYENIDKNLLLANPVFSMQLQVVSAHWVSVRSTYTFTKAIMLLIYCESANFLPIASAFVKDSGTLDSSKTFLEWSQIPFN